MEIRRLKLSGFKSFVDPTELLIEPGLTGIVGPNGCGKSNLLEALRWVMGETSARAMRGGGMDDVIFAGTTTRPRRDFAEVALFARRDPGEAVPAIDVGADGEIDIVRRIERGAGSAYRANGRDVRAKDISLLFADAATGAHSPALVSQGKIAAVIAARPAERRAMLEEAAGIAGLHVRRKDAEQKLKAAEGNLSRLEEILSDMDVRANALRRQAKAAERYTRLSEQIRLAEGRSLYARWAEAAEAAQSAQAQAAAAQDAVDASFEQQLATAAFVTDATQRRDAARTAAQLAREAASEAGHAVRAMTQERDAAVVALTRLEGEEKRLVEDQARETALARDATDAIGRLTEEIETLRGRIELNRPRLPELEEDIRATREHAHEAEMDLARAMAQQANEQAEARMAHAAFNAARTRLERADAEVRALTSALAAIADPAPLTLQRDQAQHSAHQAQQDRDAAEAALVCAETARQEASVARADAEAALSSAKAAIAAAQSEIRALRADLDRGTTGGARIIDLIRAAPGYEHALAAALGDDLNAGTDRADSAFWGGADAHGDAPLLPPGAEPLARHVDAPAALHRRLAHVGVVDTDAGHPLAVGVRIVTRDGTMRRWDGFSTSGSGLATAQRLIRVNRLAQLDAAQPALLAIAEQAQAASRAATASLASAEAALGTTRHARHDAEQRMSRALRERDDADAALDRLAQSRAQGERQLARAQAERNTLHIEYETAQEGVAALPDGADRTAEVAALSARSQQAHEKSARAQADAALLKRALAADDARLRTATADRDGWVARSGDALNRISTMADHARTLENERAKLAGLPARLDADLTRMRASHAERIEHAETASAAEQAADIALRHAETAHARAGEALAGAREDRAGALARAESALERRGELARESGERFGCPPAILPERLDFASADIAPAGQEQASLDRLVVERDRIGPVNLVAASELVELETEQARSRTDSAEITQAIAQLRGSIGALNREGRTRLRAAFDAVDGHFRRLFTALFNGGQARLELIDSDDPLEAGLEILAQPPGKKLSTLTLLSGGEQALTAIALIFGLFLTNPAPICVLDEVDAPLDDANVERFCDLLDAMVRDTDTRYLIVTHNAVTMARMHRLFGVTMVERGVSRLVSVDLGGAETLLAAE